MAEAPDAASMDRSRTCGLADWTLLFDLGNVLIDWNPRHLYRKLLASEVDVERFLHEVCTGEWNRQMDAGRPFAEAIAELSGRFPEQSALIEAWHRRWPEMLGGAIEPTVALLQRLHGRGRHRLFALTNWSAETYPIARRRYEFLDWFQHVVVSGEVRLAKPDPAIFRHAIERCGLDPVRTVFVDDSRANVEAAASLGFHTHRFTDAASLERALAGMGIATD